MPSSVVVPPGPPIMGDKGYELLVGEKWWPLGLDHTCQTVPGALMHWRERLEALDDQIMERQARLDALTSGFDEPATLRTDRHAKLARELQFLGRVRAEHEQTIGVLEGCLPRTSVRA